MSKPVRNVDRRREREKYRWAYGHQPKYRMKGERRDDAVRDLQDVHFALEAPGSYLDVSCGRGEMLDEAERLGFARVMGTEIVDALIDGRRVVHAWAHALPFDAGEFDVVSMFDVIEHLLPGDDEAACRELARVAKRAVLITANNKPSFNKAGQDLHINKRAYSAWDALFREWFAPGVVTRLDVDRLYVSAAWRIDFEAVP